jgi:hypothetical protein
MKNVVPGTGKAGPEMNTPDGNIPVLPGMEKARDGKCGSRDEHPGWKIYFTGWKMPFPR